MSLDTFACLGAPCLQLLAVAPWRDGTTHLVLSPLELMQPLAALVPRPRLHLICFGVRITSLREVSGPPLREHGVLAPSSTTSAKLLRRVFEIDLEHCPNCSAELKIIAAILEQPMIEKIFTHLGLQARHRPVRRPAVKRCRRLDAAQPRQFRRPGEQGR